MMIYKDGRIVPGQSWWWGNGVLINDEENQYNMLFQIALLYDDEQKEIYLEICKRKKKLADTDYQVNKYVEGEYTEEEYAPKKAQRAAWRNEIRELEKKYNPPTLTREEIDEAERKAMLNLTDNHGYEIL